MFFYITFNTKEKVSTLSKQKQKYILSLHNKKYRKKFGQFLVEGKKSIQELMKSDLDVEGVYLSQEESISAFQGKPVFKAEESDIQKVSFLKTNTYGVAIVNAPAAQSTEKLNDWVILLDDVRDPGNLGTIIRLAHWYGVKRIICSEGTVDYQNPKTIASSMGSFAHVSISYMNLKNTIAQNDLPVYAASMEGEPVHHAAFESKGILLMGSESHGISSELQELVSKIIGIPSFGSAESLNVAVATGIMLDNIRRTTADQTNG